MRHISIMLVTVRGFLLIACLGASATMEAPASAADQQDNTTRQVEQIGFDIPSQSLVSALDAYSTISGREVFYDGALVRGQRSTAVRGVLAPESALRVLLQGTDLVPHATGPHSFTVTPVRHAAVSVATTTAAPHPGARYEPYFATLQTDLRRVFCRSRETWPGNYQLVLRFWIAPSGAVFRSEVQGSTGNPDRDRAFAAALQGLTLNEPLPPDMPQPVTMVILPHAPRQTSECPLPGAAEGEN
jgi:hypothetical protein